MIFERDSIMMCMPSLIVVDASFVSTLEEKKPRFTPTFAQLDCWWTDEVTSR